MKRSLLILFIAVLSLFAYAHEFWLSPQKFFYRVRETAHIRFQVGEDFKGENWSGNRTKIHQLIHFTSADETLDLSHLLSDNKGDSIAVPLPEAGTHMIVFNSTNSFIHLDPAKFNAYLLEDGLSETAAYRKKNNEDEKVGKEYYQRSVKTIVQAGDKVTDQCTKPTGIPLDIVPETNPYAQPESLNNTGFHKVRFRVLFRGRPLANVLTKVWYYPFGKPVKMESLKTNNNGYIITERHPGKFMVSCVHMERNKTDTIADWQSYWSSLTFEYSRFFPRN